MFRPVQTSSTNTEPADSSPAQIYRSRNPVSSQDFESHKHKSAKHDEKTRTTTQAQSIWTLLRLQTVGEPNRPLRHQPQFPLLILKVHTVKQAGSVTENWFYSRKLVLLHEISSVP